MDESISGERKNDSGVRLHRVGSDTRMFRDTGARNSIDSGNGSKIFRPTGDSDRREDSGDRIPEGSGENTPKKRGRNAKQASGRGTSVSGTGKTTGSAAEDISPSGSQEDGTICGGTADQRNRATEGERQRARAMFREIGSRFNENRKKSKASAYEQYQRDLMAHSEELVMGEAITLKELTSVITDLEQYMRDNTSDQGKSQAQLLAEWLTVSVTEIEPSIAATPEK